MPLALTDYERTLDWIDQTVARHASGYICVAAVHTVMAFQEDPALRDAVLASNLTVPDGQPLVWAMNLLGHNLPSRVYGPDLMEHACERAASTGLRFFLYGGRRRRSSGCATSCRAATPACGSPASATRRSASSATTRPPRSPPSSTPAGADVIWVGLGVPLQEKWMAAMRERLDAPVLVGVGAAFDFHAGLKRQAPDGLQRLGLEWAFRLAQEPRRLWRRYLHYNPRFVIGFARQYLAHLRPGR